MSVFRPLIACGLCSFALSAAAADFSLSSSTVAPGATLSNEQVYAGFGCNGANRSPALNWRDAPKDAQSFALTVYDPDAPTGSGWWHWVVVNIPATEHALAAGAGSVAGSGLPVGAQQIRNDFGQAAFGGACPPAGAKPHRYVFTLYALKVPKLELAADASPALAGFMIHANAVGQAGFTAHYGR